MDSGSNVIEVLVSGVWESLDDGESMGEDDRGMNGLHVVHKDTSCCPQCFCFGLVVGQVLSSRDSTVNGPSIVEFDVYATSATSGYLFCRTIGVDMFLAPLSLVNSLEIKTHTGLKRAIFNTGQYMTTHPFSTICLSQAISRQYRYNDKGGK